MLVSSRKFKFKFKIKPGKPNDLKKDQHYYIALPGLLNKQFINESGSFKYVKKS